MYLFVDLLCGLGVTEGYSCQVFEDGHLHRTVSSIQQGHQRPGMHRPVHDLRPYTCREQERETVDGFVYFKELEKHFA